MFAPSVTVKSNPSSPELVKSVELVRVRVMSLPVPSALRFIASAPALAPRTESPVKVFVAPAALSKRIAIIASSKSAPVLKVNTESAVSPVAVESMPKNSAPLKSASPMLTMTSPAELNESIPPLPNIAPEKSFVPVSVTVVVLSAAPVLEISMALMNAIVPLRFAPSSVLEAPSCVFRLIASPPALLNIAPVLKVNVELVPASFAVEKSPSPVRRPLPMTVSLKLALPILTSMFPPSKLLETIPSPNASEKSFVPVKSMSIMLPVPLANNSIASLPAMVPTMFRPVTLVSAPSTDAIPITSKPASLRSAPSLKLTVVKVPPTPMVSPDKETNPF